MRALTALLIAGVVMAGGMAAMAANETRPEDDLAPIAATVDPPTTVARPDAIDPGPADASPDQGRDDAADPASPDDGTDDRSNADMDPDPTAPEDPPTDPATECPPTDAGCDGRPEPAGTVETVPRDPDIPEEPCPDVEFCEPINRPPSAIDDMFAIDAGSSPTPLSVLANDTDPDGDGLTIVAHGPSHDGLSCGPSQCAVTASESGTIVFRYTVSDGELEASASVTVVATADDPSQAVDDAYVVDSSAGPTDLDVLANDTLPPGAITTWSSPTPALGGVTCGPVSCTFDPFGPSGATTFTYTYAPAPGGPVTATVFIDVIGPPQPEPDAFTLPRGDETVELDVLANDADPDGDVLTIVDNDAPTLGTLECGPTECTFVPGAVPGTTTFDYEVSDGGRRASATVTIDITNKSPVAVDDDDTIGPDEATVTLHVLDNDVDPDGDAIAIVDNSEVGLGTLDCDAATCSFTRSGPGGTTSFDYTISDGAATDTATVVLRILVDAPPTTTPPTTRPPDTSPPTTRPPTSGAPTPTVPPAPTDPPASTGPTPTSEPTPSTPRTTDPPDTTTSTAPATDPPDTTTSTAPATDPPDTTTSTAPATDQPTRTRTPSVGGPAAPDAPPDTVLGPSNGVVANSAPSSTSALSLVSTLMLLAPTAALLRRRHNDPDEPGSEEGE